MDFGGLVGFCTITPALTCPLPQVLPVQPSSISHREHSPLTALYPGVSLFWGDSVPSSPRILGAAPSWEGDPAQPGGAFTASQYSRMKWGNTSAGSRLYPTSGEDWELISVLPCGTGGSHWTQRALPPVEGQSLVHRPAPRSPCAPPIWVGVFPISSPLTASPLSQRGSCTPKKTPGGSEVFTTPRGGSQRSPSPGKGSRCPAAPSRGESSLSSLRAERCAGGSWRSRH